MTLVEVHLDRPALMNRIEGGEEMEEEVEAELEEAVEDEGGMLRRLMVAVLVAAAVFAVMRWRRGGSEQETPIDIQRGERHGSTAEESTGE